MKKAIMTLLILFFTFSITFCGGNNNTTPTDYNTPKIASSFFLSSDDGILNSYGYELALNTVSLLEPSWIEIEPTIGTYDFSSIDFSNLENYNGHKLLRMSLFNNLWSKDAIENGVPTYIIEMLFGQSTVPDSYEENDDLHLDEKPEVFLTYFNFLEATLNHIKSLGISLDLILLEVEFNSWTVSTRYGNTNGANYLKNLTDRVRAIFPSSKIGILLVSTELSSMYVADPSVCPDGDDKCNGNGPEYIRLGTAQYVQKMITANVDFDIIGTRFTPDFWEDTASISDYKPFIDTLSEFEKEIFIWTVWFAANSNGTEGNLPHSEVLQAEEFLSFMQTNLDNPLVVGVDVSIFDFVEYDIRKNVGMVNALNSQKNESGLTLRSVYTDFQNYWEVNHPE